MLSILFIVFLVSILLIGANLFIAIAGSILIIPVLQNNLYNISDVVVWMRDSLNYGTFAITLFIISGNIMTKGKITEKIFNVFTYPLGKKTGFMPIITILTCMFYGAISGSGPATVAAVAAMTYPLLIKFGYSKKFAAALLMTSGSLGMVIPPSLPLLFYGILTEQNISDLFKISLVIGITVGLLFIVYTYIYCLKNKVDQRKIDQMVDELRKEKFITIFKDSLWDLLLPFIILGGIFSNILSTTDAAAVSFIYSIFISKNVYKSITNKDILDTIKSSLPIAAGLSVLLSVAYSFSNVIQKLNGPQIIGEFVTKNFSSANSLFLAIILSFLVIGMFMDGGATLGILTPILYPVITSLDINTLVFGCIIIICIATGLTTPPFGLSLFVVAPIAGLSIIEIFKEAIPYVLIMIAVIFLFAFFPNLCLWII